MSDATHLKCCCIGKHWSATSGEHVFWRLLLLAFPSTTAHSANSSGLPPHTIVMPFPLRARPTFAYYKTAARWFAVIRLAVYLSRSNRLRTRISSANSQWLRSTLQQLKDTQRLPTQDSTCAWAPCSHLLPEYCTPCPSWKAHQAEERRALLLALVAEQVTWALGAEASATRVEPPLYAMKEVLTVST